MAEKKKQTFLQGAFILVCANLLVKIIGAIFKIPLTNLLQAYGMGLFSTSYTIYTVMFIIATAGFPVAVSKMVAESCAVGKHREADRVFTVAVILLGAFGIVGSSILYFFAPQLAKMMNGEKAALAIMAMAPAVLCVSLASAFRGYFQGQQNMYPTAISEVIEALGKLLIGYTLAAMFLQKSVELAASGAVFGVTMGTFFSFIALFLLYIFRKNKQQYNAMEKPRSYRSIAKELAVIALPITIGASVASLTNVIDMVTVMNRLQTITHATPEFVEKYLSLIDYNLFDGAIYEDLSMALYGLYTGYAVPLFNMPFTIVVALSMSVVPALASALAQKNQLRAKQTVQSVIRITVLFALPCSVGLAVLSGPVLELLFQNGLAATLLQELSMAIVFVSVVSVTNAILQSYGHPMIPVVNMIIGGILKIFINYTLVAVPSINIEGAPIGTTACYCLIVVMNLLWIYKITKVKLDLASLLIKPVIAAGLMGLGVKVFYDFAVNLGLAGKLAAIPAIAVGALLYGIVLLLIHGFKQEDIEMLPKGQKLVVLMKKYHLIGEK